MTPAFHNNKIKKNINKNCALVSALLTFTVINYALAFTAVVLFYLYYIQPDDCTEHKVFISLNFIFCIIVSIVAILPKVQVMCTYVFARGSHYMVQTC